MAAAFDFRKKSLAFAPNGHHVRFCGEVCHGVLMARCGLVCNYGPRFWVCKMNCVRAVFHMALIGMRSSPKILRRRKGGGVAASRISKRARQSRTVVSQNLFGYLDQFPHFCISVKFAVREDGPVHSKPIRECKHLFGAERANVLFYAFKIGHC